MKRRLLAWLVPRLIFLIHHFLQFSIRWTIVGTPFRPGQAPFILCFWHARLLMIDRAMRGWSGPMLVSEHRDGAFIADAIKLIGIDSVRGSSTRGGVKAFRLMLRMAKEGRTLAITPDGPRGPAERVKPGVVQLARRSGLPVRALCYATKRHWRANSWDRFYVPGPFTRGVIVISDGVYVSAEDDEETATEIIQAELDEVQRRADGYFIGDG